MACAVIIIVNDGWMDGLTNGTHGGYQKSVRMMTMRSFAVADDWMMDFFFVMDVFCFSSFLDE